MKNGFKNVFEMPFNMFLTLVKELFVLIDEENKNKAILMRMARFSDDDKFKEFINHKKEKLGDKDAFDKLNSFNKVGL